MNGVKEGNGLLKINNSSNDFSGNLTIKNGAVESENEIILSNGKYKIEEKGLLRVNNNSNLNVLDKIDKSSNGVISLGNSLAELDKKYADYKNLYIGSKNDITIGANDKVIDKSISNINLGGDNGTVTLKGLELEDGTTLRNINAGNDKHRGNVVIDGLSNKANVNITIKDGINFVVNNNKSNSQFLELGYGATAGIALKNNLKDTSIGVLELTNENSIEVKKVAIGAKKDSNVILNSYTTTNDKIRFSGEGNLTYTSTLQNKELEVDAQNLRGGVVTLTGDNKNFTNKVTVMGNKNGVNNGSITLKLGSEMLKNKNEVLIKDGGILDINNNDVSIKLNNASNKYGTLTNSGSDKANVTIDSNEATTINTTLTGNLNVIKKGTGTLKFDNKNNFKGNVVMNGGELIYDKDVLENDVELNDAVTINKKKLLSGKEITIEKHAITKLTISTNKSNGDIKSSFGMINVKENANVNINSVTVLKGYDDPVYRHLNIKGTSRDRGSLNIGKVTIADGAKMYVTNQRMTMQSLEAKDNSVLTLDQASLKLVYSENTILNSGLKELELTRSKLYLRDYSSKISDKNSDKLTKVVINASNTGEASEIINGENINDNGGGGGATFVNPILLKKTTTNVATLIFKSGGFFGSGTGLTINAKVSGEGVIKLERNNGAKFEIQDNFKDFNGKVMSNNQPDVNYDFNISSDNYEDRVIGYNLTGVGSYTNKSNKDLTFTNLSGFTGKLVAQNGDVILKDENAINNTAKVETNNNTNVILSSDNNIEVTSINLENKNISEGNTNKVIKDGSGKLSLGVNTNITNFKTLEVKSGELELKKNIGVSNIDLKDSTKLNLNFINDGTINSKITGTGDLIKVGTTKIDIEGSKLNSIGSIDLQAGELRITGDKVLSNKVKGRADLTFKGSNVEVKDIENFSGNLNLENSTLTLKEDKSLNTDTKIMAKENSNIKIDLSSDKVINKLNAENKGLDTNKIEKLGDAKLTLGKDLNIKNFKNLDVKSGTLEIGKNIPIENVNLENNTKLNVNNTTDIEMTSNIKGSGDIVKLGAGKLSIASSKLNNLGKIEISRGNLEVNLDALKVFSNKLKGNGNLDIISSSSNRVEFKDLKEFSGNINAKDVDLTLDGDNALNSNINLSGTNKLNIINDKKYSNLNLNIESGKTNINSENKIDATINIKANSSLIINKDTNINKVNNEGTVVLENSKLHLDEYDSDKGIVDIKLKNKIDGILDIKNSKKDVNVNVNMSDEIIEGLKNTQLLLASSNKNINILNLDDINKNLSRKLMFKSENNNYYIYSMLKSRDLSYSNIVNNLDSIYRNVYKMNYNKFIEARYTHQTIVDNKEKVFENSKYTTVNNTDELGINSSYYIDKLNLGINLEYIHSRNSLSMKVVDGGSSSTNYAIHSLISKMGYKRGIFDISARVGVSNINILYDNPENIKSVMTGMSISINPEYRFNKNTLVKYVNEFGYENISLSGKYITKARLFNIYYKTGLSLNHKYIDLDLLADLRHVDNNTSTNKDVEIDVKNKYVEVNTLLKLTAKPTDSLRLNTEVELKFNQNKFAKYILNSGIQFRW